MLKRFVYIFIIFILFLTVGCSLTLTYNISGVIYDKDQHPVANARLTLDTQQIADTNDIGEFSFLAIPEGYHTLKIEKTGYITKSTQIQVSKNSKYFTVQIEEQQPDFYALINITNPLSQPIDNAVSTIRHINTNAVLATNTGSSVTFYLNAGTYRIDITSTDFKPYSTLLSITNQSIEKNIQLEAIPASVSGKVLINNSFTSLFWEQKDQQAARIAPVPLRKNTQHYDGLLVQFYENLDEQSANVLLSHVKSPTVTVKKKSHGLYKLNISDPVELTTTLESLQKLPHVKYAQPNYLNEPLALGIEPNDTDFNTQWNLQMIDMPGAWQEIKGENGSAVIAVLDSGIRYHADLAPNIVAGYDSVDGDFDPTDDVTPATEPSHGTHVASIIGAVTNNVLGMAGVGWNLKVMPVKVFQRNPNTGFIGASDGDIAEGIYWAVEHGANVINLSLGGSEQNPASHPIVESALQYANQQGVTVVAASGNDSKSAILYPAYSQYTIAVGAVGYDGVRTSYSNYGDRLDLTAPGGHGGNDWSGWIMGYVNNGMPQAMKGTSQATPHVAAVAGLLYNLGVTGPVQVTDILLNSATHTGTVAEYGAGILNASEAMVLALHNRSTASLVKIYAATSTNQIEWDLLEEIPFVYPDHNGDYTITGLPTYYHQPIYLFGWYDVDQNGQLSSGDYYGFSSEVYTFTSNQHVNDVNITVSQY